MFIYFMHVLDIINHDFLWIFSPLAFFGQRWKGEIIFGRNGMMWWRSGGLSANPGEP